MSVDADELLTPRRLLAASCFSRSERWRHMHNFGLHNAGSSPFAFVHCGVILSCCKFRFVLGFSTPLHSRIGLESVHDFAMMYIARFLRPT